MFTNIQIKNLYKHWKIVITNSYKMNEQQKNQIQKIFEVLINHKPLKNLKKNHNKAIIVLIIIG